VNPEQIAKALQAAQRDGNDQAAAELQRMLSAASRQQTLAEMSGPQKFLAGMGQGAVNLGRQAANLVGLKSDEELQAAQEADRELLGTGAGRAGSIAGEILATAPVGGAIGAGGRALGLTSKLGRLATGAVGQGAAEGALTAGPGNRGAGAALGAAGGAIIPAVGTAALRGIARGIEPTSAARRLMREGVDLTPGQMNPSSSIGQIEEAATNLPGFGPAIQRAREGAQQGWQRAAIGKGGAPGSLPGTVDEAYQSFGPAYGQAKGFPTSPSIMRTAGGDIPLATFPQTRGAFEAAARDPNVMADVAKRKQVNAWLQNKLTQLPGAGRGTQPMDSADLLKLRSDIRDQIRTAGKGAQPDDAQVAILRNAEQAITDALESQLPRQATDALRSTDRAYSQYKIIEDATRRAGDQLQGMTPSQLSAAVRAATPAGVYARGGGGPLRQLAGAGKQVFDTRTPPTGARLATLGGLGWLIGAKPAAALAGAAGLAATTKAGRKVLAGGTAAQKRAKALGIALRRAAGRGGRNAARVGATAAGASAANEFNQE
jgi:hypothetical protein